MSRFSRVTAVAGVLLLSIGTFAFADADIPASVAYEGLAMDAVGGPIQGVHSLQFRYLDTEGKTELLVEKQDQILITDGRFKVKLGAGARIEGGSLTSLQEVFSKNPEVLMEISIDGRVQSPWVRILPAGHSAATRAALSGPSGVDNKTLHWKGYDKETLNTGIQAVVLGPADNNAAGPVPVDSERFSNPLLAETIFLGESIAVRDLPTIDLDARPEIEPVEVNQPRHEDLFDENGRRFGTTAEPMEDPLASMASSNRTLTPPPLLQFPGIGNVNGVLPPDTEGTVGPNHYIQVVNLSFAIYDKAGVLLQGPANTNTLWSGFGGPCQTDNSGDAIFLYDEPADRFVLTQFAVGTGQAVCFAISTTPDPQGTYYLYQVNTQRFPDYFKLGVWPDPANNAYFMTTNSGFQNQYDVYAIDRENMLTGSGARSAQFFQNYFNLFMPADLDGPMTPPAGSPGLLFTFRDGGEPYFGSPPTDSLDLWAFDVDWTTPANSTFSQLESFIPPDFADFNWTVCGFFTQNCLPQPGTGQGIDSLSWWPMQRLQYRNFGDHETLVGSWTVDVTGSPDHAAPRWFELRKVGAGSWTIYQQGTHAPDSLHRFMPSIAMDGDGNIALGYSVTSGAVFPSIRYSTRTPGDPLGSLKTEAELIAGMGSQTHPAARWGDYSSMEVDPADNCTFWYTNEYLQVTGSAPWETEVGAFQIPGCGGLSVSPTTQSVCDSAGSADFDITLLDQFTGTTIMDVTGCPAGAVCSFDVNPVIFPQDMTVLTVGNLAGTSFGSYPMTVTATDASDPGNTRDANISLEIFDQAPGAFNLLSPADGSTDVDRTPTLSWSSAAQGVLYDVQVATDPGFGGGAIVFEKTGLTSLSTTVSPALDPETTFYWRVIANNACGMTQSTTIASFTTAAQPPVLLVDDDDNAPDVRSFYTDALNNLAIDFDIWDTNNSDNEPTSGDLTGYQTIIWFTGDEFGGSAGPGSAGEAALSSYLGNGGCLFLSSQDYHYDRGLTTFMQNYLGLASATDDTGDYTSVSGEPGSKFEGQGPFTLNYTTPGLTDYSDILVADGTALVALRGNNSNVAAIQKEFNPMAPDGSGSYGTVFFGFPWEAINMSGVRETVLQTIVDFCPVGPPATIFADGFESGNTSAWSATVP